MTLLIITFGIIAAGIVARGEPAGADARAYWAGVRIWLGGGDPYHPTGPFLPVRLRAVDAAALRAVGAAAVGRRLVRLARRHDPPLLWTIHWAYRQRPLETAIIVVLLAFPIGANLDTGNINLLLTLMLWGAQFTGPGRGRAALVGRDVDEVGPGRVPADPRAAGPAVGSRCSSPRRRCSASRRCR